MKESIPKELSSLAWAFAKVAYTDAIFFDAIANLAEWHGLEKDFYAIFFNECSNFYRFKSV